MFGKKTLLLIGGSGELGHAITNKFAFQRFRKWKVFNIDYTPNSNAAQNFILDKDEPFTAPKIERLHKELKSFAEECDSIIDLATAQSLVPLSDANIFEEYERVQQAELLSSMLTVHLASHFLSPNGYVAFSGSSKHFSAEDNKHLLESVCKKTTM